MKVQKQITNSISIDNYSVREVMHENRQHIIVPVVMLVEGVHNGSRGPILYSQEEISHEPTAWNGVPVTINHPDRDSGEDAGNQKYLNTVGFMTNVRFDGQRLIGDAYLDVELLQNKSQEAYDQIMAQQPLDVSTGFNSAFSVERGVFRNESYIGIVVGIEPDHLALLPGSQGACSWDDGCGIRNERQKNVEFISKLFKIKGEGGPMHTKNKNEVKTIDLSTVHNGLSDVENEVGFTTITRELQSQLDALDTNSRMHFLEEVFDDYFIYRISNTMQRGSALYKVGYQVTDAGEVTFDNSQSEEVRKVVTFQTLEENAPKFRRKEKSISNQKEGNTMSEVKKGSPCKVTALISNQATTFTEEDRAWLETLEDSALDKLTPKAPEKVIENQSQPEVNENTIKEILNKTEDPVKFIDNFMPAALGKQMKAGLRMYENKRKSVIDAIVENSKFSKEQLENWDDADLDSLHASVVPEKEEVDYSFNNVGASRNDNSSAVVDDMAYMFNLGEDSNK